MRFISTGNNRDGYRGLTVFHVKLLDVDAASLLSMLRNKKDLASTHFSSYQSCQMSTMCITQADMGELSSLFFDNQLYTLSTTNT